MAKARVRKVSWGPAIAATLFIFSLATDIVMMPLATSAVVKELHTDTGMVQAAIALVSLFAAPLYIAGGKLGDIHGKKKMFLLGLVLWGIGPVTAAVAPSMGILIGGWSFVKALGMVLALPAATGLLIASYPDDAQRGQAFAMFGVGAVAAALVGPLLMGWAAQAISYRLPFIVLAAVAALTFLLATRSVSETRKIRGAVVDWGGTALTFFAVAFVILGSMLGSRYGWWLARRPLILGDVQLDLLGLSPTAWLIGLGVVLAALLLSRLNRVEERGGKPLFSLKLFDNRTFFTSWSGGMLGFILAGAFPFIIPVFTQQALGFDSLQSGIVMVIFSIGSIILGFASGKLLEVMQPRTLMQVFLLVVIAGVTWLAFAANANMTLWDFALPMFVVGAGWGVISSQLPNIQISTLPPRLQGEGSGFAETGKELGVGLGTAVIGSVMFSTAMGGFVDKVARAANLALTIPQRSELILMLEDQSFPAEAAKAVSQTVPNLDALGRQAFVGGFQVALGMVAATALLALLITSFIPKVEQEKVALKETRELVADISSKRL